MTVLVGSVVALGMIVVVPLGLRVLDTEERRLHPIAQVWPLAGVVGAASLLMDRGTAAAVLATAYAAVTVWLAFLALLRLIRRRRIDPVEIAVLTAMVSPAVAGVSLVAERGGFQLFGFGLPVLALTVAHFHFAGFAAALLAALTASTHRSMTSELAAVTVPAGTAIVFIGYFTVREVEFLGAAVLTAGLWMLAWVVWRRVGPASTDSVTRTLFGTSALVLVFTMVLALSWAAGQVWDAVPHLSLTWMAASHGVVNAVGFALCGLLGWYRLRAELREPRTSPDR